MQYTLSTPYSNAHILPNDIIHDISNPFHGCFILTICYTLTPHPTSIHHLVLNFTHLTFNSIAVAAEVVVVGSAGQTKGSQQIEWAVKMLVFSWKSRRFSILLFTSVTLIRYTWHIRVDHQLQHTHTQTHTHI